MGRLQEFATESTEDKERVLDLRAWGWGEPSR